MSRFENLIESKPSRERSVGRVFFSGIFHFILALGAIKATNGAVAEMKAILADTSMVFLKPADPPPPPPEIQRVEETVVGPKPPVGFQVIPPITEIPKDIPPVNLDDRKWSEKDWSGKGVEGGVARGDPTITTPPPSTTETFIETEVDDPVTAIRYEKPKYPPVLQQAGIAGSVDVQYVVGIDGNPEQESFKVIRSSNKAFEEPARTAIMASTFKPAKIKGQPVRQLVQQRIVFSISQ